MLITSSMLYKHFTKLPSTGPEETTVDTSLIGIIRLGMYISMPGYIDQLLERLKHTPPKRPVNAPHKWRKHVYGKTKQYNIPEDNSPLLTKAAAILLQSTVGSLLFYSRTVDPSHNKRLTIYSIMSPHIPMLLFDSTPVTCAFTSILTQPISSCQRPEVDLLVTFS